MYACVHKYTSAISYDNGVRRGVTCCVCSSAHKAQKRGGKTSILDAERYSRKEWKSSHPSEYAIILSDILFLQAISLSYWECKKKRILDDAFSTHNFFTPQFSSIRLKQLKTNLFL